MRAHRSSALLVPIFWSARATACGVCSLAIVDRFFPPAFLWFWWPVAWFVSASILAAIFGMRLRGIPGVFATIGIAAAALFVGAAAAGPLSTIPLAIPPVLGLFRLVRQRAAKDVFGRVYLAVGIVFLAVAGYGVVRGVIVLRHRTDAEYICRWSSTGLARAMFRSLNAKGPSAAGDYRYILANSEYEYLLADTAEALVRVGVPSIDLPLLQKALLRVPRDSESATRIRSAISALSEHHGGA
jgi:hypothetical protein